MRKLLALIALGLSISGWAQPTLKDITFVQRDSALALDLYVPEILKDKNPTVIFLFGGGFFTGSKSDPHVVKFCETLSKNGFITVAIDYRLGLKGVKNLSPLNVKPLDKAITMAVEDLYAATNYLLNHASKLKIDTAKMILIGSSAGAVSVLQADYELANKRKIAAVLPEGFRYAGVISLAGAVLSHEGRPDYQRPPAPTFFFHGTEDNLVFYNKKQIFRQGFFGSNALVKRFEKFGYPYCIFRYKDMGHEIADLPMTRNLDDILEFISEYVDKQRPLMIDVRIKDRDLKRDENTSSDFRELY